MCAPLGLRYGSSEKGFKGGDLVEESVASFVGRGVLGSVGVGEGGEVDACVAGLLGRRIGERLRGRWDRKSKGQLLAGLEPAVLSNSVLSAVPVVGLNTVSAGQHGG